MANQIEVPKLNMHTVVGPPAANLSVSKLVMFVVLQPGDGDDTSNRQGHVHSRVIVRRT